MFFLKDYLSVIKFWQMLRTLYNTVLKLANDCLYNKT
jgi:hypothetical protein